MKRVICRYRELMMKLYDDDLRFSVSEWHFDRVCPELKAATNSAFGKVLKMLKMLKTLNRMSK
jgi:hypothetical protein